MLPLFYDLLSGRFRRSLTRLGRSFGRFRTALLGRSAFVAAFRSDGRRAVLLGIRKHGGLVAVQYLLVPFHALKALCSCADSIGVFGILQSSKSAERLSLLSSSVSSSSLIGRRCRTIMYFVDSTTSTSPSFISLIAEMNASGM